MKIPGLHRRNFLKTLAALAATPLAVLGGDKITQIATPTQVTTDSEYEEFKQAVARAAVETSLSCDQPEIQLMRRYRNLYNYSPSKLADYLVRVACNTFDNEDENNPYYRINKTAITALKYLGDKNETLNALERCVTDVPSYFNMRARIPHVAFHVATLCVDKPVEIDAYLRAKKIIQRMQDRIEDDKDREEARFVLGNLNRLEERLPSMQPYRHLLGSLTDIYSG